MQSGERVYTCLHLHGHAIPPRSDKWASLRVLVASTSWCGIRKRKASRLCRVTASNWWTSDDH